MQGHAKHSPAIRTPPRSAADASILALRALPQGEGWAAPSPNHIAIIMDGNARWAKKRHLPRVAGHKQGAEALKKLLAACRELGIAHLTVYAFSAENWQRPTDEVDSLMGLLKTYLAKELKTLLKNEIRLHVIGDRSRLPADIRERIAETEARTSHFDAFHLNVCLSYGARQEIVHAVQQIAGQAEKGELAANSITEDHITQALYTRALPDPDLLIRTGGEQRLSNFLLWQSAYTELYFTETLWPDFGTEQLRDACEAYAARERRYGRRKAQASP